MKTAKLLTAALAALLMAGCSGGADSAAEKAAKPTFMFWCFRKEIVKNDYHIPEMKSAEIATALQQRLKSLPGVVDIVTDLSKQTMSVSYKSSTLRAMNIEEAISLSGLKANLRPPQGVK